MCRNVRRPLSGVPLHWVCTTPASLPQPRPNPIDHRRNQKHAETLG
jgi:hypothetical protein